MTVAETINDEALVRERAIEAICWVDDASGWRKVPSKYVIVQGPPDLYTTEELDYLATFTVAKHEEHLKQFRAIDGGTNFISFWKDTEFNPRWVRKRGSWRQGRMASPTLPEAFVPFQRDSFDMRRHDGYGTVLLFDDDIVSFRRRWFDDEHRVHYSGESMVTGQMREINLDDVRIISGWLDVFRNHLDLALRQRAEYFGGGYKAITPKMKPAELLTAWQARARNGMGE